VEDLERLLGELGLDRSSVELDDIRAITGAVFAAHAPLSANEVAAAAGIDVDQLVSTYALLGIDVADRDAPGFREAEVAFIRALRADDAAMIVGGWGDDVLRVIGSALARVADAAIAGYVGEVEQSLAEAGAHPSEWMETALVGLQAVDDLGQGLAPLLVHHVQQAVERQRAAQSAVTSRLHFRYAVGFVDLVGFTSFSRTADAPELVALLRRFENGAHDVATAHRGRIVKHIGDEVMFTALEPAAACAIARELLARFDGDGVHGRGGIAWGELVSRGGDFYGPVVNLAARLVDAAVQGEVLVDEAVAEAVGGLEPAGRRQLKGFDEPVRVWSLG
jgi:adenylate cyclase